MSHIAMTTTFLTIGALAGLMQMMRRGEPIALDTRSGAIAPNKPICIAVMIGGAAVLGLGLWLALFQNIVLVGIPLAFLGIAGLVTPIRSLGPLHIVTWTNEAIEGPSKVRGLTLGKTRTRIDWSDIRRVGYAISGNWFVEALDGRRIYWTPIHGGYGQLVMAIKRIRPDLKLPASM